MKTHLQIQNTEGRVYYKISLDRSEAELALRHMSMDTRQIMVEAEMNGTDADKIFALALVMREIEQMQPKDTGIVGVDGQKIVRFER